jgi:hypothetical protein
MTQESEEIPMESQAEAKVELKYCEGCGALTLRYAENPDVYCAACRRTLQQQSPKKAQPQSKKAGAHEIS